jgi:transformer-2 protein
MYSLFTYPFFFFLTPFPIAFERFDMRGGGDYRYRQDSRYERAPRYDRPYDRYMDRYEAPPYDRFERDRYSRYDRYDRFDRRPPPPRYDPYSRPPRSPY